MGVNPRRGVLLAGIHTAPTIDLLPRNTNAVFRKPQGVTKAMITSRKIFTVITLLAMMLALGVAFIGAQDDDPGVLNIYSARHYGAMEAPFVQFQEDTGIEVRVSAGSPRDLLTRLRADLERGDRSVADLFLSIDAGTLDIAAEEGLFAQVESDILTENIAEPFRSPENYWYGLSIRPRSLVYNPENVTEEELASINNYEDMAADIWEGRACMRPAAHIYTVSLFSSVLYNQGEEVAADTLNGVANNVTRYINSDTRTIEAVAAGECDIAFVNYYYVARLAKGDEAAQDTFNSIALKWMGQGEDGTGVFFNINGAGVVRNAANYDNAVRFIEYMSQPENQCGSVECFPGSNNEYPTNPTVEPNETLQSFGEFEYGTGYPLWEYGAYQQRTVELLEEAGFGFEEN
jgi:iron(III) transport system substrate-binding protein